MSLFASRLFRSTGNQTDATSLLSLLSFPGNVTDFTLKEIFADAQHLQEVVIWGESRSSSLVSLPRVELRRVDFELTSFFLSFPRKAAT